jgi:hypothetical protein
MSSNSDNVEPRQLVLMAVHEAGRHVFLGDGSSWDIGPGSSSKVVFWNPSQLVTIEKDDSGYMLTNLDTIAPDRVPANPGSWDPPFEDRIL